MTEDEYLDLSVYMILEGYGTHNDEEVMDAIVMKHASVTHYTDEELERLLGEFREIQKSF